MAEHSTQSENEENTGEIRGQLVKRLAVAGALVAVLLGVLAVFDRLATTDEVEIPVFTKPVPVAPRKEVTQPVTAATNLPEPPAPAVQEPPPAPVVEETVVAKAETKAEVQENAKPEIRGSGRSTVTNAKPVVTATPESSPRQYSLPAATAKANVQSLAEGSAEPVIAQPTPVVTEAKPAVTPSARISDVRRGSCAVETNSVQRLFSGFLLQAGVFTSPQRAEELHAKLTLSGVPSTLETRVQVGPFKTRQEAEAAQEKLKQLGVETLLVPPKGARN